MAKIDRFGIHGQVSRGFESVREVFAENFIVRRELGGGCCAFHGGEKVVDLWGGIRNKQTGELWEEDTMVVVHSATKGLAAMTLAIAHSRSWLDYEARVAEYWPEFAQQGKVSTALARRLRRERRDEAAMVYLGDIRFGSPTPSPPPPALSGAVR